jgi:hypothetical protein
MCASVTFSGGKREGDLTIQKGGKRRKPSCNGDEGLPDSGMLRREVEHHQGCYTQECKRHYSSIHLEQQLFVRLAAPIASTKLGQLTIFSLVGAPSVSSRKEKLFHEKIGKTLTRLSTAEAD